MFKKNDDQRRRLRRRVGNTADGLGPKAGISESVQLVDCAAAGRDPWLAPPVKLQVAR